jgi:hypothetical protein
LFYLICLYFTLLKNQNYKMPIQQLKNANSSLNYHSPQLGNNRKKYFQRSTQISRDQLLGGSLRQYNNNEDNNNENNNNNNNKQQQNNLKMSPPLAMRRLSRKCHKWLSGRFYLNFFYF